MAKHLDKNPECQNKMSEWIRLCRLLSRQYLDNQRILRLSYTINIKYCQPNKEYFISLSSIKSSPVEETLKKNEWRKYTNKGARMDMLRLTARHSVNKADRSSAKRSGWPAHINTSQHQAKLSKLGRPKPSHLPNNSEAFSKIYFWMTLRCLIDVTEGLVCRESTPGRRKRRTKPTNSKCFGSLQNINTPVLDQNIDDVITRGLKSRNFSRTRPIRVRIVCFSYGKLLNTKINVNKCTCLCLALYCHCISVYIRS